MEDVQWKQRAKRNWFRHGDRNTQYFHAWAKHRRKINHIEKIVDAHGIERTTPADISQAFIHYFQDLLSTDSPVAIEECVAAVPSRVTC
ncbi:hypothetical protein SLA2020_348150 [Shorea laevis]